MAYKIKAFPSWIICLNSFHYLQFLGNSYGIGNSMELDFSHSGHILCLHKTPRSSTGDTLYCCHRRLGNEHLIILHWSHIFHHLQKTNKYITIIMQVLSFLSLGASSSTASVTSLLLASEGFCSAKLCTRYQLSAAMAFLSWFLSLSSTLFNLWLLPSV